MKRQAFTLVEMLVVIVIIAIMASMLFGAMQLARESSREAATKATIAKLNNIILRQLDSYKTRRLGVKMPTGLTPAQVAEWNKPRNAAQRRLDALRDTMRMEMPDAASDITNGPVAFDWGNVPQPALHRLYQTNPPTGDYDAAQCLYMIVSMGNPEAMEQFHQSEIGMVDGRPCFVDGWGRPIMFLRWAPGFTSPVQLGAGHEDDDHDPFDTRKIDGFAFRMVPLIYSAGPDGQYDINLTAGYVFAGNPYQEMSLGQPADIDGDGLNHHDNITNHAIDQR